MSRRQKRRKRRIKNKITVNKLLIILIPILLIGTSLAKYLQEKNMELLYEAQNFYFESDLLSDNSNQLAYTYDIGNDTISIVLRNNIDELRYSEVNIEYDVCITDIQRK